MSKRGWEKVELELPGAVVDAVAPVIVSASRSTDIPAFYSRWFCNRLRAGYLRWTNPFNAKQQQYVSFQNTRLIVFWSKNPAPLLRLLPEVDAGGINYYFQFTLNDYEKEGVEPNLPPLLQRMETFKALSRRVGKEKVIWRYDPLILTDSLTIDLLVGRVARLAEALEGYTDKLVISFADISGYRKVRNSLARNKIGYLEFTPPLMAEFAQKLGELNREWGLKIATCAEGIDLSAVGIRHNRCIDDRLISDLFKNDTALMAFLGYRHDDPGGSAPVNMKDRGQRSGCGCLVSKDVGMYDTCNHLCMYCYAITSSRAVGNRIRYHDPGAEAII